MTESVWNGFKRIDFTFEGREAILVFPACANENRNWLLKTEYFDAFPEFELDMLKRGGHLAYIKYILQYYFCSECAISFGILHLFDLI